jgi:hypothetical protein
MSGNKQYTTTSGSAMSFSSCEIVIGRLTNIAHF